MRGSLVANNSLVIRTNIPEVIREGGASTWDEVQNKPFSTVDTENGLAIYDNTLMIDTLDKIATIDYVNTAVQGITPTVQSDWNQTDDSELDYIKNKPSIRAGSGYDSVVEGHTVNTASGTNSHAEGNNSHARGLCSHAEGASAFARGDYSHAEGMYIYADGDCSHVQGKFNVIDADDFYADIVGNGTAPAYLSNAEATDWNGNKYLAGDVYTQVTNWATTPTLGANKLASENYVDTAISNIPDPDWSDVQNKPTFATVATSGDYDDLDNKPTIPQADGTTIIDNNGVWSSVGGGSDPDEKSIITNAQGKLEEAVPIYTEVASHNVGGVGLNIDNYRAGTSDGDFYIDTNETELTFVSGASSDNKYYNIVLFGTNGWVSAKWKNTTSVTYNCVVESASSYFSSKIGSSIQCFYRYQQDSTLFPNGNHYGVKFHIYDTSVLPPWSQWTGFLIYPTEDGISAGDTLETQCETLGLTWTQGVWNEQIIHKVPNEYLNLKSDEILNSGYYPMLYNDANGDIRAKRLGVGTNMSLSTLNLGDGTQGYQFNCTVSESPIGGNIKYNSNYNMLFTWETIDSTHGRHYINLSNWNSLYNWGGANTDLYFTIGYNWGSSYYSDNYKSTGVLHLGATNADISYEGFEQVIDSITVDVNNSNKAFCINYRENINPQKYNVSIKFSKMNPSYYPQIQTVSAFWLPLDKETIITDSNGNIKTAIPAPPTTDGTYTLQVTVTNGEPAYSWI